MKKLWLLTAVLLAPVLVTADIKPASIFTDNMVLQRGIRVPVWGTAAPGERVVIQFSDQTVETVADAAGNWRTHLAPLKTSCDPAEMILSGKDSSIKLVNILIGEVWLCSGQSNMNFTMRKLNQPEEEILAATNYPLLRLFKAGQKTNPERMDSSIEGAWSISTYETASGFSGVATYFGRALSRNMGIPVGLIQSAWGGTPAESWTSHATLKQLPFMTGRLRDAGHALRSYTPEKAMAEFEQKLTDWQRKTDAGENAGIKPVLYNPYTSPYFPSTLYNGMIAPLCPFAIRGVIWYQGESNVEKYMEYRELMAAMIANWRENWGQGNFPFLYVQLASYMKLQTDPVEANDSVWPHLRDAQTKTLSVTNTAMVVITDVGDASNIHPKDKKTVGERLALAARARAYGEKIVYSGPAYLGLEIKGDTAIVHFDNAGSELTAKGDGLTGFAIAGEDRKWRWADAQIQGNDVIISSPEVKTPVAVRYNWANNPVGNLFNKEGLPASLFRTDSW
jgi:sialate O-acetylesterase